MPVYVSTSCLANPDNVFDVLDTYVKAGLKNVELGSRHNYIAGLSSGDFGRYDFSFIVHHYFPPPEEPIIVNVASPNPGILKKSKTHIKKAIEFCHSLGIELFTFHAGACLDPDDNFRFPTEQSFSYDRAFETLIESVNEINSFAEQRGVRIAIENNVLAGYNLVKGQNQFLLLCRADEYEKLWGRISSPNVGMLLDLGHLKVTSHWLEFDRYEFIDRVKDRIFALHLHDNNGQVDEHREMGNASWCLEVIRNKPFAELPLVLESSGLSIEQIIQQQQRIEETVSGQ